jgi:4-diphosphocytidyl-2-C-methyl-D-erythritol kinase
MNKISVKSPAKLNLYLKIISKLPQNYHELSTRFQLIDIYDDLSFLNTESNHISVICSDNSIKEENNIVYKTAMHMQKINNGGGIKIEINKAIPKGAGLGGGSSNAASTIILLNKLWEMNLNLIQMQDIGRDIGADIPFFIIGRNAYAKGIGDIFEEIDSDTSNYIVIHPGIFNSTKTMFDKYDATNLNKKNMEIDKQNSFWSIFLHDNEQVKIFYEQNIKKI